MSITIGCLLVMLLLLAVLYKDLAPRHTQREATVISATFKLDTAQELLPGTLMHFFVIGLKCTVLKCQCIVMIMQVMILSALQCKHVYII